MRSGQRLIAFNCHGLEGYYRRPTDDLGASDGEFGGLKANGIRSGNTSKNSFPGTIEGSPQLPERIAAARLRRRSAQQFLDFGLQVKCAKNSANHAINLQLG
jgi:hypothetical protein